MPCLKWEDRVQLLSGNEEAQIVEYLWGCADKIWQGGHVSEDASNSDSSQSPANALDHFAAWKEYERIAMHFNDLLLRIRSQSLAAVAAFATIAGVLLKTDAVGAPFHWGILSAVFAALAIFWLAIWILDFRYYNRLLLGAVNALIEIEENSRDGKDPPRIDLSTKIEEAVKAGWINKDFGAPSACWCFYSLVMFVLLAGMIASYCHHRHDASALITKPITSSVPTIDIF